MPWWVILLIVWVLFILYDYVAERISQRKKKIKHAEFISACNKYELHKLKKEENSLPLDYNSEQQAQRIKELLYHSVYYQNRNVYEFDNILKELAKINKEILIESGKEKLNLIIDRVENLCGNERVAFAELINIMRNTYLPEGNKSNSVPLQHKEKIYIEKGNHGTLQDSVEKADAYWFNRNFGTGKSEPFLLYEFKLESEAKNALAEVGFIHVVADTGRLICSRICQYGAYVNQAGHWEVIIAGSDFTLDEFNSIREIFKQNNGFVINERAPEETVSRSAEINNDYDLSMVVFKEKYQKPADTTRFYTYEVFEAPNKETAIKFLEGRTVFAPLYYLLVDTPQGSFGKDNGGIYDA